jgi:SIT family siderophore-iron:H+ symporter-like MFS transporter
LLVEIVIADVASLRSRLFFSYVPTIPFLFNTWISGEILETVTKAADWRWGEYSRRIMMTAISNVTSRNRNVEHHLSVRESYPLKPELFANLELSVSAIPLVATLWWINYKTKRAGDWDNCLTPFQMHGGWKLVKALFWQLDIVGMASVICIFGFILVPFTIAGGTVSSWKQAKIIAPMVIGILMIPIWIMWERATPHPMVPFFVRSSYISHPFMTNNLQLLKDRAIWGPVGIAFMLMFGKSFLMLMVLI